MSATDDQNLELAALRLLANREHSRHELRRKLKSRATQSAQLEQLLDALAEQGAQNDRRYTQEFIASRRRRGFGPVRIRTELTERGVSAALIDDCLEPDDAFWDQVLLETAISKFGGKPPEGFREWAKRARFLEYRGFAPAHIRRLLRD
jgi:regulatory protein